MEMYLEQVIAKEAQKPGHTCVDRNGLQMLFQ